MLVRAIVMIGLLWRRVKPALRLPIVVYVAGIVAMGLAALTTDSVFIIAGALLFMASDGLLATRTIPGVGDLALSRLDARGGLGAVLSWRRC